MTQGSAKKPPVQGKVPSPKPSLKQPVKQQPGAKGQASKQPVKQTPSGKGQAPKQPVKQPPTGKGQVPQPPVTMSPKQSATQRASKQVIWADDNDVDFEDITFVLPIIISVIVLFVFFLRKYIRWTVPCPGDSRLNGKTVIVTGANSGIGRATATELARRGAKVILGCRDKPKGDAVALMIRGKTNNQDVHCYHLDLASLSDIKSFVDDFNQMESSLHVLINNAAYMGPKATTVDHYERSFGVNFLGHFYLTYLLRDKLRKGAPSRVINVISDSYTQGKLNFDDLALADYDIYKAYGRSKLAMVVFTHELHRRLASEIVFTYGVHPGMVCTDLMRNWPGLTGNILRAMGRILFKSPEEGCQTVVYSAVSDKIRHQSGKFYNNCACMKIKASTRDQELGLKLWNTALHLCGLDSEIEEKPKKEEVANSNVEEVAGEETKKDK